MDPLSIIVLAAILGAGLDLATGGRVRAEFGGGARGAAGYIGSAGRKRWRESKRLARQERMKTPTGRAVQGFLDELGGLGRGLVRGWRSGARRARKQWRDRLGDGPIPAVRICRDLGDRTRTWLEDRANGDPNAVTDRSEQDPNGNPERAPEQSPEQPERAWWDPNGIPIQEPEAAPVVAEPEAEPAPAPDPNEEPNDTTNEPAQIPIQPTRTEGNTVADINSAPAAIALFEAFRGRFEEPESLLTALRDEIASAADSMGDFAIGGEGDLNAGLHAALEGVVQAREALDGYLSSLHLEYDASIEAAESKQADAHRPMQEV